MGRTCADRAHDSGGLTNYSVFGEFNYALGDANPGDGVRGTFDQLYPTAHDKFGLADQVGWRNIHHVRTGLEVRPHAELALTAAITPCGSPTKRRPL